MRACVRFYLRAFSCACALVIILNKKNLINFFFNQAIFSIFQ